MTRATTIPAGFETVPCPICGGGDEAFVLRSDYRVVRCAECGMVRADPRPDADARRKLYGGDYYVFDQGLEPSHRAAAARDVAACLRGGSGRLLDVGCSTGYLLEAAASAGWEVEGVEFSPEAAARARARTGRPVHAGTLEDASLPEGRYQAVTMLDVLEHVPDPVATLREARRLLAPGGRLIVECPNWWELYRRFTGPRWVGFNPFHLHFFTPWTLARAFETAGLTVVEIRTTPLDLFTPEGMFRLKGRRERGTGRRKNDNAEAGVGPAGPAPASAWDAVRRVPRGLAGLARHAVRRAVNAPLNAACGALGWGRQVVVIGIRPDGVATHEKSREAA